MRFIRILSLLSTLVILNACVSYKARYRGDAEILHTVESPSYVVYLIGDAGNAPLGQSTRVFDHLKAALDRESASSAIVWLGDNIYPVGLAPQSSPYHEVGRHRLLAQLNTMENFKGYKFFVPGNHDWYTYGRIGLRRQELLIDSVLSTTPNPNLQEKYFVPSKGCGDPQIQLLTEDLGLLLMDTHWYLNDKVKKGDLSVCKVKSAEEFLAEIETAIDNHKDKALIVASHHPPYTYSRHGGKFGFKDHVFPLTQRYKHLYYPLPLLGFTFNKMRTRYTEQDVYYPTYIEYRNRLTAALRNKGTSIVASGHEHTLQLIDNDDQYFVVSGAGTKKNKVAMGKGSHFAIGEKGYVKVIYYSAKEALIQFIVPGLYTDNNNVAYEKVLRLK